MVLSEVTGGVAGGAAEHPVWLGGVASHEAPPPPRHPTGSVHSERVPASRRVEMGVWPRRGQAVWGDPRRETRSPVLAAGLLQDPLFGAWLSGCR